VTLFGASPTQLRNAAGYCQDTAQYIEGMRLRVEQIKTDLTTRDWEGGAAQKFVGVMAQWDTEFKGVIRILEDIYDRLNVGSINYATAEAEAEALAQAQAQADMDLEGAHTGDGTAGRIDSLINTNWPND
jgi:WXG100 family type VII secretion target